MTKKFKDAGYPWSPVRQNVYADNLKKDHLKISSVAGLKLASNILTHVETCQRLKRK